MIRLLFVLFVTLGGFAAAALWNFRGDGGMTERIVSPELRTAVAAKVDRLGLPELALERPAPKTAITAAPADPKPKPQATRAETPERATPAVVAASAAKSPATKDTSDLRDLDDSERSGAGGSAAPHDPEAELVASAEVLVPKPEFALDYGPAADRGKETASDALPVGDPGAAASPDWDDEPPSHDADRSARLIRRMIAVYRSSGPGR